MSICYNGRNLSRVTVVKSANEKETVNYASDPNLFEDTEIVCIVCGTTFTFEKGEAEFFYKNNLLPPKRCPMCRKWKRRSTNGEVTR